METQNTSTNTFDKIQRQIPAETGRQQTSFIHLATELKKNKPSLGLLQIKLR